MVAPKHLISSLALIGIMSCVAMSTNGSGIEHSIDVIPQSRSSFDIDTFTVMGDIDLDGISSSIADFAALMAFFSNRCIIDPGPWPPPEMVAQSDINCDSLFLSVADLIALWHVILGEIEPCYGGIGAPPGGIQPEVFRTSTSQAYAIEIENTQLIAVDTGWVDIVITEGTESFCAFQFHLEYDTNSIELLDVKIGEAFSEWDVFNFHDSISGTISDLKLAGHADDADTLEFNLTLPPLPVTLARLKFGITTSDSDVVRDINFVWDYCGDNALAVSDSIEVCGFFWPHCLAVSQEVFDAENNNITGTSERYGGADDVCLVGGLLSQPVRFVNFTSGRLTYDPSCCQGITGNVDGIGEINVSDLSYLVFYLYQGGPPPPCPEETDVDVDGSINVADLTYLVDYLFFEGPAPQPCP
jgi:hypothetical protein